MKRASWITLLAAAVLSSFASAAEKGGKAWWPQFRGPNSSGVGEGSPPVHFGPDQLGSLESRRGVWTLVAHCLGGAYFPDGVRSDEQAARHCLRRSAHRQDSMAAHCFGGRDRK